MESDIVEILVAAPDHAICLHLELVIAHRIVNIPQLDILRTHQIVDILDEFLHIENEFSLLRHRRKFQQFLRELFLFPRLSDLLVVFSVK